MNLSPELQKRVTTGVYGGLGLIALIVFGGWLGVFILSAIVSLAIVYEFTGTVYRLSDRSEKRYVLLSLSWFVLLMNLFIPQIEFSTFLLSFMALFTYFLFTAKRHGASEETLGLHFKELMFSVFGAAYLIFIPVLFPKLYESAHGLQWILLFFFMIWTGDSFAYFVGKKYGRRKLYPLISAKKTVEGALGSLIGSFIVAILFKIFTFKNVSWFAFLIIPILVNSLAQVGDLCESFFKRAFNIKDSGSSLPGHGGFLDRFDSIIFSLPVMYACVRILA